MVWLSRLRLALARRPWLYWVFVACCAALVWMMLTAKRAELDHERRRWGETRRVWIAKGNIAAGEQVRTIERDFPVAMVPASALDIEPTEGLLAATSIAAGEVLVASDISADANSVLPSGWVVFAFSRDNTPGLRPGSAVAVFGSGQRWCDGLVIAVGDDDIDVGVPSTCADAVSAQVASGTIVLGLTTR